MSDEALRRADDLLSEMTEIVETARAVPMSTSCVLPRERLLDLLDELREVLPPEMTEARVLVATRDRVLREAHDEAVTVREHAVAEADAVLADARHRAEQLSAEAQAHAADMLRSGEAEHARLVSATAVHQAAARAATAVREDAERYQAQISAEVMQYDGRVRTDADRYAADARAEAERYATKLTVDAENYAERTLTELSGVLRRAAATAEQGRTALAHRRSGAFAADLPGDDADWPLADRREPPISA